MEKRYSDGRWFYNQSYDAWCYLKPGYYEPGVEPSSTEFSHQIDAREIEVLIKRLDEEGWIKPRLDERLRTEDLKITHRLLDIIEKQVIKKGK